MAQSFQILSPPYSEVDAGGVRVQDSPSLRVARILFDYIGCSFELELLKGNKSVFTVSRLCFLASHDEKGSLIRDFTDTT